MKKVPVVFLSADPTRTLSLDEDLRRIKKKVRAARYRDALSFDVRPAARFDDLIQALSETKPQIVHFSGHADMDGLMLVGSDGYSRDWVSVEQLEKLFNAFRDNIQLVVLSACSTHLQARALADIVGCAIGTPAAIGDEAAIAFNAEFYRALAFGESVGSACTRACAVLAGNELDEVRPELLAGPGVDPAQLILVPKERRVAGLAALLVLACGMVFGAERLLDGSERSSGLPLIQSDSAVISRLTPEVALETGRELYRSGNYTAALPRFKQAAEAGNAEAMGFLGAAYLWGQGTERTPELAAHWLAQAADRHDARGMNAYGAAYEEGFGVGQSYRWARHWYEAAANQKHDAEAMRNLARLHREGLGTTQNDSLALVWYLRAVRAGSLDAMVDVGSMYAAGVNGRRDADQALRWFQGAADAGSSRAMYAIGRLHEDSRNFGQALVWYHRAASAGSADAMNNLGVLYQNGRGVPTDRAEASRWYRQAAKAGSSVAAANLTALDRD